MQAWRVTVRVWVRTSRPLHSIASLRCSTNIHKHATSSRNCAHSIMSRCATVSMPQNSHTTLRPRLRLPPRRLLHPQLLRVVLSIGSCLTSRIQVHDPWRRMSSYHAIFEVASSCNCFELCSGLQRVHLNRALVKQFFESAAPLVSVPNGEIHVTIQVRATRACSVRLNPPHAPNSICDPNHVDTIYVPAIVHRVRICVCALCTGAVERSPVFSLGYRAAWRRGSLSSRRCSSLPSSLLPRSARNSFIVLRRSRGCNPFRLLMLSLCCALGV